MAPDPGKSAEYVVVARRYRPQLFEELVGQQQVSQALVNAITTNRVGHAYLFTGARGVGKTSAARIFAKALDCAEGPSPRSCNQCDICQSIATGDDIDVLEIDGASNRGIDEIRQLRSNVNIRPSRARFKIYIIDEVHMLTTQAFNALLKTLEEPPEHVKFVFCTTDPEKIPITVLSRCQRFDFAPVQADAIVERLRFIVQSEGIEADEDALQLLARRAGGSMRDSQSLLEQLLSFTNHKITTDGVHAMLGTAHTGRLAAIAQRLIQRDAAAALHEIEVATSEGVDAGQLAEQLLGYFRDMMAAAVGCDAGLMLHSGSEDYQQLGQAGEQLGLETILATLQILDQAVTRMRQSTYVRVLLEVALVRICQLENLDELSQLIGQLRQGAPLVPTRPQSKKTSGGPSGADNPAQKKTELPSSEVDLSASISASPQPNAAQSQLSSAEGIWKQALSLMEDMTADYGTFYHRVAISAPNRLVVSFKAGYTLQKEGCERPERRARIEQALCEITGRKMRVDFEVLEEQEQAAKPKRPPSRRQKMRDTEKHPLVRKAIELFDAEITRLEEPQAGRS